MPGKLTFTIVQGSEQNKTFVFEAHDTLLLGRADDCHIRLASDDTRVSRHHFLLEVNPPDACLRDLGSLNGTWVNGIKWGARNPGETPEEGARRQFPTVNLHDGDEIRAGDTVLRLHVELPPAPPAPMCCQRCGKDVAAEAGPGWSGDYICTACRAQVEADPSAMLAAIFAPAPRLSPGAINLLSYIPLTYLTEPYTITGHLFALRRRDFDAVGGLHGLEEAARIDDDHELARRVRAAGLRCVQTPVIYDVHNDLATFPDNANQMHRWFIIPKQTMVPQLTPYAQFISLAGSLGNLILPLLAIVALVTRSRRALANLGACTALFAAVYAVSERSWLQRRTPLGQRPWVIVVAFLAPLQALAALAGGDAFTWRGVRYRLHRDGRLEQLG